MTMMMTMMKIKVIVKVWSLVTRYSAAYVRVVTSSDDATSVCMVRGQYDSINNSLPTSKISRLLKPHANTILLFVVIAT